MTIILHPRTGTAHQRDLPHSTILPYTVCGLDAGEFGPLSVNNLQLNRFCKRCFTLKEIQELTA